ncbi:mono/diheme cytochrome c family protein [Bradyrhizobium elkanii USDA 61]|uniref:Mono/diheme cytochrome c family protein n=2 Tax=Bradyrhizobium elkanii TaxID=29448 RepID=A0A8I2C1P0_BRAEL|nr:MULTISPECIES: c-type cytochrome [Bradyrhizobium]MBP1290933.1 mono/diheme cytochrome c family protein [Bradyrhizobium elkanii]MCP1928753.1 mono/diheme cytochrome c family protein [Bradyrhizobium elkanii]MCS3473926.1 mono/diheme cytochrome c family protein [Bradyrhizobium elkanii]MCS3580633.1 mono/diheme cytochrome c family protein [Bradyrhizobium elkanii]MCS3723509.1 mono/diheme cytochrome c family protein [Bradyrhizobium elkanii]
MTGCLKSFLIGGLTAIVAAAVHAEDADVGKAEFQASCASCHGADGKGKGPVSAQLNVPPTDLTTLTKNNNGVFPISAVYETIDGRKAISAHGTHEMPAWGERFNPVKSLPHTVDPPYDALDPSRDMREVVVRTRILAVIDYLNRIQQK